MSVSGVNNNNNRFVFELPKPIKFTAMVHEKIAQVTDIASTFVHTLDLLTGKVSHAVKQFFGPLAFVGGIGVLFTVPSMISNLSKSICSSNAVERIKSICRTLLDASGTWMSINAIFNGLRSIKVLSATAFSWTSIVNVALFPLQFVGIAVDSYELRELKRQKKHILSRLTPEYIKENHVELEKVLGISKKCRLKERAEAVKGDRAKTEELIQLLRRRINTKYNLKLADLVIKCAGVGFTGALICMPVNPLFMGLSGATGVAALTNFGIEKLMLTKDPFTKSNAWYSKVANKLRQAIDYVTDAIDRKKSPVHMAASAA